MRSSTNNRSRVTDRRSENFSPTFLQLLVFPLQRCVRACRRPGPQPSATQREHHHNHKILCMLETTEVSRPKDNALDLGINEHSCTHKARCRMFRTARGLVGFFLFSYLDRRQQEVLHCMRLYPHTLFQLGGEVMTVGRCAIFLLQFFFSSKALMPAVS